MKLWSLYNYKCLLNLKVDKNSARLNSSCFLNDKEQIYIVISNDFLNNKKDNIQVFDFKGNKIK